MEKYRRNNIYSSFLQKIFAVLEYGFSSAVPDVLPFTEFYLRCFGSFSLGESSKVILNKFPIYIISLIFFHLNRSENGIGDRSAEEHLKNPKTCRGS
jgi:hypothetical protein